MQSVLTLFWIFAGLSLSVGTVLTVVGLVRAPEGYEDQDGFQYVRGGDGLADVREGRRDIAHPSRPELA